MLDVTIEMPGAMELDLSYSHPSQPRFRRNLIRIVERLSGQPKLRSLYTGWARSPEARYEPVFEAAMRLLNLRLEVHHKHRLDSLPREGGLLLVANHPFGIVDGLSLGKFGMDLRGNVSIMTNSLLCRVPEVEPYLLPVDFSGTHEARRLTGETRRRASDLLLAGKVVAIFPAGGIATANRPVKGAAVDAPWHPFVGRLATLPGVTTLPLHFQGQNSRLFQIASHSSYPLRLALIFHETRRLMGRSVHLTVGQPVASDELHKLDRWSVAETLRRRCMELAEGGRVDPDEVFIWPPHLR
ncbi:MAG: glycerol acyltransferase [Alphaproteobacteria bacterium]|nr:glycerol acyltransferase [Alphaproteobacteria bacterium]